MKYLGLIFVALILGTAIAFPESDKSIPSFKYNDLLNDLNKLSQEQNVLKQVAKMSKNLGGFLITDIPHNDDYVKALKDLEKDAESCFNGKSEKIVSLKVSPSVVRSTSAVSSVDPSSVHPACIRSSADVIVETMNKVGALIHQLIDNIAGSEAKYKFPSDLETAVPIGSSPNLDHIHLYKSHPESVDQDEPTATLHTDNGLFLLATPSAEAPLHIMDLDGQMLTTMNGESGMIVLFGRALNHWLLRSNNLFRAAPHSVPALKSNKKRVIFARMYVAPKEALPYSGESVKFGEFFMAVEDNQLSTSNLCPAMKKSHQRSPLSASAILFRKARNEMCDEGTEFCWMGCLPVDSSCPSAQQTCYSSSHQPCCLEGQTAADGCADMDPTCEWHCS